MIEFENVSKAYDDQHFAVNGLDLKINKGEFFVIIGPSGCGKTTLLKMINRLIYLTDGTIRIDGKRISDYNLHELRWNIGYVLQQIALFPHMTIAENIAVVPEMKKWSKEEIQHRVRELLEMVGLDPDKYSDRKPKELSGGEQQRVGVIRALAADPEIILMDEPFSALDPLSRAKLQDDLLALQRTIRKTIVFVSHDMQEALKLGDRICVMKDGQIEQLGTPQEIVQNPANDFVRKFIGLQNKVGFSVREAIMPLSRSVNIAGAVAVTVSLPDVLRKLADEEYVQVMQDGEVIGEITRESILKCLVSQYKERGYAHDSI